MEKDAFIQVIKTHQPLIYKVCTSYCAYPEERKDLEQEILYELWRSFKRYDGRVKWSTWIYKVALNTAIRFYHQNKERKQKKLSLDTCVITLATSTGDPAQEAQVRTLYRLIEGLDLFDRALILLYLDGYKQKEIAEILGISPSNVATKINRIKKKFQQKQLTIND